MQYPLPPHLATLLQGFAQQWATATAQHAGMPPAVLPPLPLPTLQAIAGVLAVAEWQHSPANAQGLGCAWPDLLPGPPLADPLYHAIEQVAIATMP